MTTRKFLAAYLLTAGLVVAGCGQPATTPTQSAAKGGDTKDDHEHEPGPHDGHIIDFAGLHAEFCVDHGKKQVTVYMLDGKHAKTATPVEAAKLELSIKSPAFQVDLFPAPQDGDPKGKASRFVATHDNFGKEQEFEGTISGTVNGKNYSEEFKEEKHDHPKDKKK
jgi:hypothetical protein